MMDEGMVLPHKITLSGRKNLTMSGVTEVINFDENTVTLKTSMGTLSVHGENLQLKNLSAEGGQVAVDGKISALLYEEPRAEGGWLKRLLR